MNIKNEFEIGDGVYVIHDPMQNLRMVTAIMVSRYDLTYELTCSTEVSRYYDFEISKDKTIY